MGAFGAAKKLGEEAKKKAKKAMDEKWEVGAKVKARNALTHAKAMYGEDSPEAKKAQRKLDRLIEHTNALKEERE